MRPIGWAISSGPFRAQLDLPPLECQVLFASAQAGPRLQEKPRPWSHPRWNSRTSYHHAYVCYQLRSCLTGTAITCYKSRVKAVVRTAGMDGWYLATYLSGGHPCWRERWETKSGMMEDQTSAGKPGGVDSIGAARGPGEIRDFRSASNRKVPTALAYSKAERLFQSHMMIIFQGT